MPSINPHEQQKNYLLSHFEIFTTPLSDSVRVEDVAYLQDKYQSPAFDPSTGLDNAALKEGAMALAQARKEQPRQIVKAKLFEYLCDNMQIDVNCHDLFPGFVCYNRYDRPVSPVLGAWRAETYAKYLPELEEEMRLLNESSALMLYPDFDHSVPDWDALFALGFPGLLRRAREYRARREAAGTMDDAARNYFDAIEIQYHAVLRLLERLAAYAQEHGAGDSRMEREIACLKALAQREPRNTYEILYLIFVYFFLSEHVGGLQVRSLGNMDRTIYPYMKRDLEEGRFSEKEIRQFFAYFLLQFAGINNYWGHPFYLGGTDENGDSVINPLSYLILEEFEKLHITTPKIQLKVNRNTPRAFVDLAFNMIRRGNASLVFVCEPGVVRTMMGIGRTYEEARTCDIKGCYEYAVRAREVSTAPLYLNMLKPVELALHDGLDPYTGKQIGPHTGSAESMAAFDDFYAAYIAQLGHLIDEGMRCVDAFEPHLLEINPTPLFSATITHSLETAKDAFANGSKYNTTAMLHTGLATAADAMMAVRRYVYEKKELSLAEMRDALSVNWKGYEKLRLKILKDREKFGNNQADVDLYAQSISRFAASRVNLRPNARGGFYKAAMHSARTFFTFGERTGATPDGRMSGDEMSKNLSPTMGMDVRGVTALLSSVAKIDSALYPEDCNLDVMLHPATVQGEDGLVAMRALLQTYMEHNGISIHFNVFDPAVLEEAQKHPEKYKSLQVRVCGWNVLFNNLQKKEQDAYILRAKNIAE